MYYNDFFSSTLQPLNFINITTIVIYVQYNVCANVLQPLCI